MPAKCAPSSRCAPFSTNGPTTSGCLATRIGSTGSPFLKRSQKYFTPPRCQAFVRTGLKAGPSGTYSETGASLATYAASSRSVRTPPRSFTCSCTDQKAFAYNTRTGMSGIRAHYLGRWPQQSIRALSRVGVMELPQSPSWEVDLDAVHRLREQAPS